MKKVRKDSLLPDNADLQSFPAVTCSCDNVIYPGREPFDGILNEVAIRLKR
jgi:hypothetical protein